MERNMNVLPLGSRTTVVNSKTSSPHIPKLCLNEMNTASPKNQHFCEQVAYIYRQFAKEFDRIAEWLSEEKKEQNFLKIMKKIQFQIEKTQAQILSKLNNTPISAPVRLKKSNDQDTLTRIPKRKSLKTKGDRYAHYSPRVVESMALKDKDRSKLDKIKGSMKSPQCKIKKERSASLIDRPFPVTHIYLPAHPSSLKNSEAEIHSDTHQTPSSDSRIASSGDCPEDNKRLSTPSVPPKTIPVRPKKKGHKLPLLQSLSTSNIPSLSNKHVRSTNFLDEYIYTTAPDCSPHEPGSSLYPSIGPIRSNSQISALITPRNSVSSQNSNLTKNIVGSITIHTPRTSRFPRN